MTACSRPFDESGRHCTAVSESTPGQNGTRVRVSDILSPSFPYHPVQLAEYKKKQKSFLEPFACHSYFLVKIIISGKKLIHWPSFIYIHKFSIETPCINHKTTVSSWIRFRRQLIKKKRMAMTTMPWQVAQMSRKPSRLYYHNDKTESSNISASSKTESFILGQRRGQAVRLSVQISWKNLHQLHHWWHYDRGWSSKGKGL